MRPDARLQAAIELLDLVDESNQQKGLPVDALIRSYFRKRRYAGSGDRRAVRALLFDILRQWGVCRALASRGCLEANARSHVIAYGACFETDLLSQFGAGPHGPSALSSDEDTLVHHAKDWRQDVSKAAQLNVPEDVFTLLADARDVHDFIPKPEDRAPLTLRTNKPSELINELKVAGYNAEQTPYSPDGLFLPDVHDIPDLAVVQQGLAEVQDEASQLCSLMVSPPPGAVVVDLCAGAGGKALAIAARHPKVKIVACDISKKRLSALSERAARAGVENIEVLALPSDFPSTVPTEIEALSNKAHWVLVDAPCSSSGTWRRHPALRHRYTASDIARFSAEQARLARAGLALVRPGGRLTFATCSVLQEEGEAVMADLRGSDSALEPVDYRALLSGCVKKMPDTLSKIKEWLLLSPVKHGCDGFFCATVRRQL
ncbi:MAG: RsmB/NOP family class I SAM-dependent RNA methyltransferase [Pseudomonadota bacterium]